jgi:hypothetical protein
MDRSTANSMARAQDDEPIPASTGEVQGATARNALSRVTNLEIDGVQVQGPKEGFGALWRKRYWVRLTGADAAPVEIIRVWRERFGDFWPDGNVFFGPFGRLDPGDVALLNLEMPGGARLSSGVVVLDTRPESFTLITPEGHIFAGVITFSAFRSGGEPVAQIEIMLRASDPIFEVGMTFFGHRQEDQFWQQVLSALAAHFGVHGHPEMHAQVLDRRYQWSQTRNVTKNALIRSALFRGTAPFTRLAKRFWRPSRTGKQEEPRG